MAIFQDIQILLLEQPDYLELICCEILHFLIFQEILPNFGGDGIFHFLHGFEIIYTFLLGGSKGGMWMKIRNTFIIFLVSGFWHGANWTFIVWGFLNALFIMPSIIFNTNRNNLDIVAQGKLLPSFKELISILITFSLTVFAWIFFRSENLSHAFSFISKIFSESLFSVPYFANGSQSISVILLTLFFVIIEWIGREQKYAIETLGISWKRPLRYAMYYVLVLAIIWFGGQEQQFIYFQF